MNELTFAGWLAEFTATRAQRRQDSGEPVLIASGAIEERQVDADGRVRRCDLRFNSSSGRKLASGQLKRPGVAEGRDPRNEKLRFDARRKAIARGLPCYFTCNIADAVLCAVALKPNEDDSEVGSFNLAKITRWAQAPAYREQISQRWSEFLDALETKLTAVGRTRPTVTTEDVVAIRDAMYAVAAEVLPRALRRVRADPTLAEELRAKANRSSTSQPHFKTAVLMDFAKRLLNFFDSVRLSLHKGDTCEARASSVLAAQFVRGVLLVQPDLSQVDVPLGGNLEKAVGDWTRDSRRWQKRLKIAVEKGLVGLEDPLTRASVEQRALRLLHAA